ncbi:PREDICTED: glutathione S-transferase D7-like isoform X1 [Papilio xuthus]|uniref:Glutathione S-transferase D7-like isoform X1 n=2 Tax=Papilio xuthus TaxID=66420 RepID=A0AAJ6ZKA6_PAPXU|nr:PREDICTED: glutathione S-transferase D7-like isoform X1 [Papilio xuthus]XP_013174100.1 PREDICTED: glutathione S-transferase D7-like isoform X1 [Papilio xuthus]
MNLSLEEEIKIFWEYIKRSAAARSKRSKMPNQPIKVYYYPVSPPCRAVLLTAKLLGLDVELVLINIMEGEQKKPEFIKMNPQHTVPTIDDNGFILWESRAIMAYLVNAYGADDALYPNDAQQRAIVDQRLYFDFIFLQKSLELYWPMIMGKEYNEEKNDKLKEVVGWLNSMLEGRKFVAGDKLSIADITTAVTMSNLDSFGFDYSSYPNVKSWFERTVKELEPYGYEEINKSNADKLAMMLKKE